MPPRNQKLTANLVNWTALGYNGAEDDAYLGLERLKKSKPNAS
jgi:hypothetical protein